MQWLLLDHGVMFGAIDFYKEGIANGIKPIIGCEVYVAPRKMTDKEPGTDTKYNHLILLAKNMTGYHNLCKLVSLGFLKDIITNLELIKKYLKNIMRGLVLF